MTEYVDIHCIAKSDLIITLWITNSPKVTNSYSSSSQMCYYINISNDKFG